MTDNVIHGYFKALCGTEVARQGENPSMTRPVNWDIVKVSFPAFAELRDRMNLRIVASDHSGGSWVVRIDGERFHLMVGEGHADQDFRIRLSGRIIFWSIPTVLHGLGLWSNLHTRVDPTKLAQVLEQNLDVVLAHIAISE